MSETPRSIVGFTLLGIVVAALLMLVGAVIASDADQRPARCGTVFALMHSSADSLALVAAEPYCANYTKGVHR